MNRRWYVYLQLGEEKPVGKLTLTVFRSVQSLRVTVKIVGTVIGIVGYPFFITDAHCRWFRHGLSRQGSLSWEESLLGKHSYEIDFVQGFMCWQHYFICASQCSFELCGCTLPWYLEVLEELIKDIYRIRSLADEKLRLDEHWFQINSRLHGAIYVPLQTPDLDLPDWQHF